MSVCIVLGSGPVADYVAGRIARIGPDCRVLGLKTARKWLSQKVPDAEYIRDVSHFLSLLRAGSFHDLLLAGDSLSVIGRAGDSRTKSALRDYGSLWEPHALLRAFRDQVAAMNITIHSPLDYFPELSAEKGLSLGACGAHSAERDLRGAINHLKGLSWKEQWQSYIVDDGVVKMSENYAKRTDALITSFGISNVRNTTSYPVLCKVSVKTFEGIVTPTIGFDTVRLCIDNGINGIVIEGGKTIILQRPDLEAAVRAAPSFCFHTL